MTMKDPQSLSDQLMTQPYNSKLKGSRELAFHLDCGFNQDSTRALCMDPGKYINCMEEAYVQHYKTKLVQRHRLALQKGGRPELGTYPFLNDEEKEIYQLLVGSNQWSVSIERFDIQSAIVTMLKF